MVKNDVESILIANWYFIRCKTCQKAKKCEKTELARKYLTSKINKALSEKKYSNKAYSILRSIVSVVF